MYADDTTLTSSTNYSSIGRLEGTLNSAIAEIVDWAASNKLPINEGKTKAMLITGKRLLSKVNEEMTLTIKGTELELVPSAKLLGLEIDSELSFTSHVEKLCKKLSQRIGVLKKIRSCLPTKQRLLYYNTMIRSVLHYVSSIWTSCDKDNLVVVVMAVEVTVEVAVVMVAFAVSVVVVDCCGCNGKWVGW